MLYITRFTTKKYFLIFIIYNIQQFLVQTEIFYQKKYFASNFSPVIIFFEDTNPLVVLLNNVIYNESKYF